MGEPIPPSHHPHGKDVHQQVVVPPVLILNFLFCYRPCVQQQSKELYDVPRPIAAKQRLCADFLCCRLVWIKQVKPRDTSVQKKIRSYGEYKAHNGDFCHLAQEITEQT